MFAWVNMDLCMNKLLTTISLLCFSVAANADIFVCTTTSYSEVDSSGSNTANSLNDQAWVIDTNKGFRMTVVDTYVGRCSRQGVIIKCEKDNGVAFETFVINAEYLNFSRSLRNQGSYSRLISNTGICSKI